MIARLVKHLSIVLALATVLPASSEEIIPFPVSINDASNESLPGHTDPWDRCLAQWRQTKQRWQELYGTQVSLILTDTHQQITDGPNQGKGRNLFWWDLTLKQSIWDNGLLIVKTRGSNTNGTPPNGIDALIGSQLTTNWAAYETEMFYVAHVYWEQKLWDDKLLFAVGKLGLPYYFDDNKIGRWDFFSHALIRNRVYPHRYHTIGAIARYDWNEHLYIQAGLNDGNGVRSQTGLNTAFDGDSHWITQFEVGLNIQTPEGREGNYRLECWNDGRQLSRHDGSGTQRNTPGIGLSLDQMLTDQWGLFVRCGLADGKVHTFNHSWSLGATCRGFLPGRERDVLGMGICQAVTHEDYRQAYGASASETIMELYYKIKLNTHMSFQLDCIGLLNPGTNPDNENALIPGIRIGATF